jgi:hypothetical protein
MKHPAALLSLALAAAVPSALPAQEGHSCHAAEVDARGDHVMGFDHSKTTHHFLLTASGGIIDVSANDPNDAASRDAIRTHLEHVAGMFAHGNYEAPMLIHGRVPPGVPEMKSHPDAIRWSYEKTEAGARVVASSKDPAVVSAIHSFLQFQIEDHRTGDSTEIPKS